MFQVDPARFDELVDAAIDRIPQEFFNQLDQVVIQVAEAHPQVPTLLGLYEGVPLTERTNNHWVPRM